MTPLSIRIPSNSRSDLSLPASTPPIRKLFHWNPDGSLTFRVDWSSIESLLGCNRSAEYKLIYSRQGGSRSALTFGAAIHAGLEVWYRNKDKIGSTCFDVELKSEEKSEWLYLLNYTDGEMYVKPPNCEAIESHPFQLTKELLLSRCYSAIESTFASSPPSLFPDYRTSDYAIQSFHSYITHYQNENLTPFVHDGKPMVEFSFAYPLGKVELPRDMFQQWGYGTLTDNAEIEASFPGSLGLATVPVHIEWTGIIDMLAEINGDLYVVDHKTTSIISQDFFDGFEIAMQPTGYFAAMRAAFPGLPIKGFMANVLACRKPVAAITKSGKPSTSKPFEAFRRQYQYSDWHVNEFKQDALALVEELFANVTNKFFPKKTQWCVGKYGKCPYFDVCSLPPQSRMDMLMSDQYINNTWKPV